MLAGFAWFFFFSGGILIDSMEYRVGLGWKRDDSAEAAVVGRLAKEATTSADGAAGNDATVGQVVASATKRLKAENAKADSLRTRWAIHNFLCAAAFFTPTNVALLALLAGFIGGCASNLVSRQQLEDDLREARTAGMNEQYRLIRRRIFYISEHPLTSTVRSFIVYLILISGLYVLSADPFEPNSQSQGLTQYVRFAGLVSLLSFVVGYDPTRFEQWLRLVPSPGSTPQTPDRGSDSAASITITRTEQKAVKIEERGPDAPSVSNIAGKQTEEEKQKE